MKKNYYTILLFIFISISSSNAVVAQTTLTAGDMMVIGCDMTANTFRVVLLQDITAGTVIKFTDIAWMGNATTNAWEVNSTASTTEGTITWTTTNSLVSGTVLDLYLTGSGTASLTTVGGTPISQSITVSQMTAVDVVHPNGENLFIYQGSLANPYFVTGFNDTVVTISTNSPGSNGWTTNGSFTTGYAVTTNLPNGAGSQNGLVDGVTALGMIDPCRQNLVQYTGVTTSADVPTWKSRFMNRANWSCGSSGITNSVTNTISILPLAVNEFELASKLKLYPNPAKDLLYIYFENLTNPAVTICDVNGRMLKKIALDKSSNTIVISDLETGVYLFKIESDEGMVTKYIVKQ